MRAVFLASLLSVATLSGALGRFVSDSNSQIASSNAIEAFSAGDYSTAVREFESASEMSGTPVAMFDLGTALVAEGDGSRGTEVLGRVMDDPELAGFAHYNRGNAALAEERLEDAIREYVETLRIDPHDQRAKRNLEIALKKKREQGQSQSPSPSPDGEQNAPTPRVGEGDSGGDELDALLRSVEQQEQEELRRMRRSRAERRPIGW